MAAKIDGLVIEIGANTSSFKQSMRDVQNEAKGISKDLKTVSESLKLDPDNVGKAADKLKLLKDQAENASKKVEVIKKAIEALNKEYEDKSSKEYTDQLHKLESQLESATREQELANAKVKAFAEQADNAGKSAFNLGDIIKGSLISSAIKKGLESLVDLAKSLASHLINAGKQLAEFSWDAVKMAGEWNDATSTSVRAFAEFSDDAVKYAEDSAMLFGIYSGDLLQSMNNLGLTFSAMSGITREESLEMSKQVMSMAADIRAAFGGDFNDIQNNLQKALTGTYKGLQQYGVFLSDAEVKAYALEKGIVKTTVSQTELEAAIIAVKEAVKSQADALEKHGENSLEYEKATNRVAKAEENLSKVTQGRVDEITKAQKAEATLLLLQEKFGDVSGQAVAEADAFPALLNRISTAGEELKKKIGVELLPVVEKFMQKGMELLQSEEGQNLIDSLVESVGKLGDKIMELIENGKLEEWIDAFKEKLPEITEGIANFGDKVSDLIPKIFDLTEKILALFGIETENEKIKKAFLEVEGQIKQFATASGTDVDKMVMVIHGYAEATDTDLLDIYNNWDKYQPEISNYIKQITTDANGAEIGLDTALMGMTTSTQTNIESQISSWDRLKQKIQDIQNFLDGPAGQTLRFFLNPTQFVSESIVGGIFGNTRASGGPAEAGRIYQVNDDAARRKEFFIPYTNGYILNGNDTERIINNNTNNSRTYGDTNVYINARGANAAEIADELGAAITQRRRMAGSW